MTHTFTITQRDIDYCPIRSLLASHYRDDRTCLCVANRAVQNFERDVARRAKAANVEPADLVSVLAAKVAEKSVLIEYDSLGPVEFIEIMELEAPDGFTQTRLRLNVGHRFVQMMCRMTSDQRSKMEVVLFTIAESALSNQAFAHDLYLIGQHLEQAMKFLDEMFPDDHDDELDQERELEDAR